MPGYTPRFADGRPSVTIPDLRIAYDVLFTTTYLTGSRYRAAVHSACGAYITEPSPSVATTARPGQASCTPSAAPIAQPSVPVLLPKNSARGPNGRWRSTCGSDEAD